MSDLAVVFQIGSLGDSIVSVPTLLSLRQFLPSVSEYLLITKIESNLKVAAREVFDMAWKAKGQILFERSGSRWNQAASAAGLVTQLRRHRPRYCVYLAPAERSAQNVGRDAMFFKAGGVKELIGFRALAAEELAIGPAPKLQNTEAYLRFQRVWGNVTGQQFLRYSGTPILSTDAESKRHVKEWLGVNRRYPQRRLVALCPYSNWSSRDIPSDVVVELLSRLENTLNLEVVVLGGGKDVAVANAAIHASGAGLNACGLFSVNQSGALLQSSRLAICTESGPMHLACALGIPSVIAFSRTTKSFGRWFPLGNRYTILYRDVECAGCDSVHCSVKGHPCMTYITADQILAAAVSRLDDLPLAPPALSSTRVMINEPELATAS
jgi:hypothetical protein